LAFGTVARVWYFFLPCHLFYEVPVPSQESERPCIYVLVLSMLSLPTSFLLKFRVVTRVWHFLFTPPCFIKCMYQASKVCGNEFMC